MAKRPTKKKSPKSSPTVTLRLANPARRTVAKKKPTKKKKTARRNPSTARRGSKKGSHRRRRRNPGSFSEKAGQLAVLGAAAVATAVIVTIGTAKIYPGKPLSLYGIPAVAFLAGVALSKSSPKLGVGIAAGAFAPFALPLASKVLTATTPASTPAVAASGIGRSMRQMAMGRRMGAVDMGAVNLHSYS
jgi:hypothetical protein